MFSTYTTTNYVRRMYVCIFLVLGLCTHFNFLPNHWTPSCDYIQPYSIELDLFCVLPLWEAILHPYFQLQWNVKEIDKLHSNKQSMGKKMGWWPVKVVARALRNGTVNQRPKLQSSKAPHFFPANCHLKGPQPAMA